MDFSKLSPEQMKVADLVVEAAEKHGVDPNLLLAQAFQESKFQHIPNKDTDAFGVMQIRPSTAEANKLGDIRDLRTNVYGGARLMKQYLDKYKTPEAALLAYHQGPGVADEYVKSNGDLKAVGPKGLDYVIKIGEYGGFGQQPAAEATEEEPKKEPFVPVADTFPPQEETKQQPKPENVVSPTAGAVTGLLASTAGQMPFKPDLQYAKPPPDVSAAEEAAAKAQRRADIARNRLEARVSSTTPIYGGADIATLEAEFRQSQTMLQQAEQELQAAVAAQKSKVPSTPAGGAANAPQAGSLASSTPQIITDPNAPVSRTATEQMMQGTIDPETGTTGRQRQNYNEVTSFHKLQREQQEKALTGARAAGATPDIGEAERLRFGMPDATPSGIIVKPEVAAPLKQQAELEKRMADEKAAQERLAQQQEMNRLQNEKKLAAEQHSEAKARFNQAQKSKTSGVTRAQNVAETAADRAWAAQQDLDAARKAANNAPSAVNRVVQNTGVGIAKGSNLVKGPLGAIGGYEAAKGINTLANMSLADLQKRYDAGDRSPALMDALAKAAEATAQVGFGTAAAAPAIGATGAKIKGAGVLGTAGLGALQFYNALNKKAIQRRENQ
jgi:soluble lytic murein transglycosylase-like protein